MHLVDKQALQNCVKVVVTFESFKTENFGRESENIVQLSYICHWRTQNFFCNGEGSKG